MGFPYLAPLKTWVVDILKLREKYPNDSITKMPYAVLTSGALVVKSTPHENTEQRIEELKKLIKGTASTNNPKQYKGCIIANNVSIFNNYQLNETIVGFDFDGMPIKVENEKGRMVSMPIIESVEIDTDGANNTLKTTRISIRCFTLKQLEMFELFFLKPGMNLLLEYGDSTLLNTNRQTLTNPMLKQVKNASGEVITAQKTTRIEDSLIMNKLSYDAFVKTFAKYYIPTIDNIGEYTTKIENASGTYDYTAGKVTDFSYSIETDGTYSISLEISQGNQYSLAIYKSSGPASGNTSNVTSGDMDAQILSQISVDLSLDATKLKELISRKKLNIQDECFNFQKLNEKQEDELVSLKPYMSFRFILDVLLNYATDGNSEFEISAPEYEVNGKRIPCIPVQSHKYLISSNEVIFFPGKLPAIVSDSKTNEIILSNPSGSTEFTIGTNNYSFNINGTIKRLKPNTTLQPNINGTIIQLDTNTTLEPINKYTYGNALNCYILYSEIVNIWRKSYTRLDVLEQLLNLINENGYGLFDLRYSSEDEGLKATILDYKIKDANDITKLKSQDIYRFKPTTINSIVKSFEFTVSLDNLVAGRTIFNAQKFITDAILKKSTDAEFTKELENKTYTSVDYSQYSSSDGYYSINKIDAEAILNDESRKKLLSQRNSNITTTKQEDDEEVTNQTDLSKIITEQSKNFKKSNASKTIGRLIYVNPSLIQNAISKDIQTAEVSASNIKKSTLTPFDITLSIDGMSGFTSGEYFRIDGIPETYNTDGVFQITNIKHSISADGWVTTLEASWRIIN